MFGTFASRANFGCSRKGYNLYARGSLGKAIPTRVIKLWRLLLQLRYQRRIEQQMKSRACLVAVETIHELDTGSSQPLLVLKSNNLQYNMVGQWVDGTIILLSDGPMFILIDWEKLLGSYGETKVLLGYQRGLSRVLAVSQQGLT